MNTTTLINQLDICSKLAESIRSQRNTTDAICLSQKLGNLLYMLRTYRIQPEQQALDMLESAWGIIANAGGGNWLNESVAWRRAAEQWRDDYHRCFVNSTQQNPNRNPVLPPEEPSPGAINLLEEAGNLLKMVSGGDWGQQAAQWRNDAMAWRFNCKTYLMDAAKRDLPTPTPHQDNLDRINADLAAKSPCSCQTTSPAPGQKDAPSDYSAGAVLRRDIAKLIERFNFLESKLYKTEAQIQKSQGIPEITPDSGTLSMLAHKHSELYSRVSDLEAAIIESSKRLGERISAIELDRLRAIDKSAVKILIDESLDSARCAATGDLDCIRSAITSLTMAIAIIANLPAANSSQQAIPTPAEKPQEPAATSGHSGLSQPAQQEKTPPKGKLPESLRRKF